MRYTFRHHLTTNGAHAFCLGEKFNSVFLAQKILADQLEVKRVTDEDWEDEEDNDEDEDAE